MAVPKISPWELTPREAQIMDTLCLYGNSKRIARELGIAEMTINGHLKDIYNKMDSRNRVVVACRWQCWRILNTP